MNEDWKKCARNEIKELQYVIPHDDENGKEYNSDVLPYYLNMKEYEFTPSHGKCVVSFLVSLDDDVDEEGGKIVLKRASSSRAVIFAVDISIKVRPGTEDVLEPSMSYPHSEPKITLTCGSAYFSSEANIDNGDLFKYSSEDDWNSSIKVRDVAINIASKIRRSIRSANICLQVEKGEVSIDKKDKERNSKRFNIMKKVQRLKELRQYIKRTDVSSDKEEKNETYKSKALRNLKGMNTRDHEKEQTNHFTTSIDENKIESIGSSMSMESDEIKNTSIKETLELNSIREEDERDNKSVYTAKSIQSIHSYIGSNKSIKNTIIKIDQNVHLSQNKTEPHHCKNDVTDQWSVERKSLGSSNSKSTVKKNSGGNMEAKVGDVIMLYDNDMTKKSKGLFPCKIMNRPKYFMDLSKTNQSSSNRGFQDLYMMLTNVDIVEMKRPQDTALFGNKALITLTMPILSLLKVEYSSERKSVMLYFKENTKEPIEYETPYYADVVGIIQSVMKQHGIRGKYRTPEAIKNRRQGLKLCKEISKYQKMLGKEPNLEEVRCIIDLHHEAVDKLSNGLDDRHSQVLVHLDRFLSKEKVARVLTNNIDSLGKSLKDFTMNIQGELDKSDFHTSEVSSISSHTKSTEGGLSLDDGQSLDDILDSETENDENNDVFHEKVFVMAKNDKGQGQEQQRGIRIPFQRRLQV